MPARTRTLFADRSDAGRQLATHLEHLRGQDVVVLGLPRGGVPVAREVADSLDAPLDVIVVRKLGVPFQPELAMGAIGEDGVRVLDRHVMAQAGVTDAELRGVEQRERTQLAERVERYRKGRPRRPLGGRVVVVVDDGLATGSTARAACAVARHLGAARVVLAVPVGAGESLAAFEAADEIVVVATPRPFVAVGRHYRDFAPVTDEEVLALLDAAARRRRVAADPEPPDCDIDVEIPAGRVHLEGHLHLPEPVAGVVIFAHGSGSSRHSPRNRFVAEHLYDAGLGTLLLDLLIPEEENHRRNVFDVELLGRRLDAVTTWLAARPDAAGAHIGYFGASTGAAAALWAAARPGSSIDAVVSRGGRPDLAADVLDLVRAPTRLIVGSLDDVVLGLNRSAQRRLRCVNDLQVVAGANHLFEEPGTLAEAAELASQWFVRHLLASVTDPIG